MTLPRHIVGRTSLVAASLLAITTLATTASPAPAEPETVTPGDTPASGSLGQATGTPVEAARGWLREHADLFAMSAADIDDLVLVSSQELAQSQARAVLFRQDFDGVAAHVRPRGMHRRLRDARRHLDRVLRLARRCLAQ